MHENDRTEGRGSTAPRSREARGETNNSEVGVVPGKGRKGGKNRKDIAKKP